MENCKQNKIPAALMEQARKLTAYDLLKIGKNAVYGVAGIIQTAIEAALAASSVEATAKAADADTVFYHLGKLSVEDTERMLKQHVGRSVELLKRRFGGRKYAVAIDYTDEMFYGNKKTEGVVGTKRKGSTNYAFQYLTVNIVVENCRFFLFSYPIFKRGDNWRHIEKTLDILEEFGVNAYVLLLDREFNNGMTLKLLDGREYDFITPSDQDSKFIRWKETAKKFSAISRCWKVADAETTLIMLQEGEHVYGYLTNIEEEFYRDDAYILSWLYSKRWGIETAHRVEDGFRIHTTTKNWIVRYFFFVISILIYNLWVWVNLNFCLVGKLRITVAKLKRILLCAFEEFWLWLRSPQRWFSMPSLQNEKRGYFACFGRLRLPICSAVALP